MFEPYTQAVVVAVVADDSYMMFGHPFAIVTMLSLPSMLPPHNSVARHMCGY